MKIKLDENISFRLVQILSDLGHDVDTVIQEQLTGSIDEKVWTASQSAGRFLITQDLDFSNINRFKPGTHCGLLLIRLRNPGREALFQRIRQVFEQEDVESWKQCFVVVSDLKIRVQRPKE